MTKKTDTLRGLTDEEVLKSRAEHGPNELTPPPKKSFLAQWGEKFRDPTVVILCVCTVIAIVLGFVKGEIPWDGLAIFVAVAIATLGGTWSEFKADKAFELLKKDGDKVAVKVRRNGIFHLIASTEVVVGDVVFLEGGDRVPADGCIVESREAKFDEAMMTGESVPVSRDAAQRATGGTFLLSGSATIVIDKVGDQTELGLLASSLGRPWVCPNEDHRKRYRGPGRCEVCGKTLEEGREPPTPLQRRLGDLADKISIWGTIGGILIFLALAASRAFSVWQADPDHFWTLLTTGAGLLKGFMALVQYFMVAVAIIVVAVPEGLPLAVVIALGLGMRKIRADNNLVRKMVATETIGSTTVICSDKTGTLTLNSMRVVEKTLAPNLSPDEVGRIFDLAETVNATAELEQTEQGEKLVGNPTECALLLEARDRGVFYAQLRDAAFLLDRVNFSSDRKTMSTLIRDGDGELLLVKGAPERVFAACGNVSDEIRQKVSEMAGRAVRALAIAYRRLEAGKVRIGDADQSGLVLLGVVGLADAIRPGVARAVERCRLAGIAVKMITGDHPLTARAIAEQIGIFREGDLEMTGETFATLSDEEILGKIDRVSVIARALPETKVRLVQLLQRKGEVVAMTGDGTNDAPALIKADVGISMGLRGTDVAKQASDIVLTDDNFESILKAVHWGRTLYENLQKFLQFQLTANLSAMGIALLSPIIATLFPKAGFELQPLTVLQYLWINLIMDTLAALAFGLEPPREDTLRLKPKKSDEPFLSSTMLLNVLVISGYMIALLFCVEAFDLLGLEAYRATTEPARFALMKASLVFNCYVWFQLFHMFNARSVRRGVSAMSGIFASRSFFMVMALVAAVQFAMVQWGGAVLHTAPLPPALWGKTLVLGASAVLVGELLRLGQRLLGRRTRSVNTASAVLTDLGI